MSDKREIKRKLQKLDNKPPVPARSSLLDVMWDETRQQEEEHRMALAFFIGREAFGDTLKNWPTIDPDSWRAGQKAFLKFFGGHPPTHPEHVELLIKLVTADGNFSGKYTVRDAWDEVFGPVPYPEAASGTPKPEAAHAIRPAHVSLNTPLTKAPGF